VCPGLAVTVDGDPITWRCTDKAHDETFTLHPCPACGHFGLPIKGDHNYWQCDENDLYQVVAHRNCYRLATRLKDTENIVCEVCGPT
jgi:hypothetical protein